MKVNDIDKTKIAESTVLELVELGRQIPQHTRQDLIRRLDAVIGGPTPHPVLTSH